MIQINPGGDQTPDADFRSVLESRGPATDSDIADLIEEDGRARIRQGLPCDLRRYTVAIPNLAASPIALDAAIDISLKSLARGDGCESPDSRHAESLLRSYPEYSGPIRITTLLNEKYGVRTAGLGSSPVARTENILPRSLGSALPSGRPRYELRRVLGRGFSGTVFEAIDHLLSDESHAAKVAVKLIAITEQTAHRQAAEATKARRVEHPNVVRVLDRGLTDESELFLVYELVPGGDLHQWFERRQRKISVREAATIVEAIAQGVHAAHEVGLVHCDLKPANVLMTADGKPRVSDFGVAARTSISATDESREGRLALGTLAFAAPEQVRQLVEEATPRADVYGLGGMLFYLLTGVLPNGNSDEEVKQNHHPLMGRSTPPSARAIRADLDPRLDRICARAMQSRPADRYASAAEFAADLRAWLGHRPIGWMQESLPQRAKLWVRRGPVMAALSAAIVLAVVGGGAATTVYAVKKRAAEAREAELNSRVKDVREGFEKLYKDSFMRPAGSPKPKPSDIKKQIGELESRLPKPIEEMKK